uniref:putative nuclease HARBI1 n=1 Tax=Pristiophorus japonicus TaxID=55135 RepID=UPI00398EB505
MTNLLALVKPTTKSYEELCTLVREHLNPKESILMARYRFYTCQRSKGQEVASYIVKLRRLAGHCKFDGFLEQMLRDFFVLGIDHEVILCKLLNVETLNLSKAIMIAQYSVTLLYSRHNIKGTIFYTNGSFRCATGDISNISQFAIHCPIREITDAQYTMRRNYISFPITREKQLERACGFARIVGFPMVQDTIDCTHLILRAAHNNPEVFRNCKDYHSLNVQLVHDHTCRILTVKACYPDSSHDAFILRQTGVSAPFQPPHQARGWLLGDKGYLLSTWLMTPLCNPNTPAQHSYNESQAVTKNIIVRSDQAMVPLPWPLGSSPSVEWVSLCIIICCMLRNLRSQPLPPGIAPPQEV